MLALVSYIPPQSAENNMPKFLCLFYEIMCKSFGHPRFHLHKFFDDQSVAFFGSSDSARVRARMTARATNFGRHNEREKLLLCNAKKIFLFRTVVIFMDEFS